MKSSIFVIGVSGTGKTTIAAAIADATAGQFIDADDYHPEQNVTSMKNGVPLTDDMRAGWLQTVCKATNEINGNVVVACSALKQNYRDTIRSQVYGCTFVFLDVAQDVLEARIAERTGHYMPVSLLQSQLQTLQVPTSDETDVVAVSGTQSVSDIVQKALKFCQARVATLS